jgi:hypothetical protein
MKKCRHLWYSKKVRDFPSVLYSTNDVELINSTQVVSVFVVWKCRQLLTECSEICTQKFTASIAKSYGASLEGTTFTRIIHLVSL